MNINFDKDKKLDRSKRSKARTGTFEDMQNQRAKDLPEIQESIQEALGDYDGGMVAIVRIHEDENGDPDGQSIFIGGVATFKSSKALVKALDETQSSLISSMAESAAANPEVLSSFLTDAITDIADILKKGKK